MKKKILSIFLIMCMIMSIMPLSVSAATQYEVYIDYGSVTIDDNTLTYKDSENENQTETLNDNDTILIKQTDSETANTIWVLNNANVNIILDSVNINATTTGDTCAFYITDNSNVNLTLNGDNTLTSTGNNAGLQVDSLATLTIKGAGTLNAKSTIGGAGIGGASSSSCGTINIDSGTITANSGGFGAGIGSGYNADGGTININGGVVNASGVPSDPSYSGGAGIGGGYNGDGGTININGGTVTAIGGAGGAGIGGGLNGNGGDITIINDTTVTAIGGAGGAGIGSGNGIGGGFDGGTIKIDGGDITANGGDYSAGIGGGYYGDSGTITINGGIVTATGSVGAAGIGGGTGGDGVSITIKGGKVNAEGYTGGAGIGGGINDSQNNVAVGGAGGVINIDAGIVTAIGGENAAGIGGGWDGISGNITIGNSATVIAASDGVRLAIDDDDKNLALADGTQANVLMATYVDTVNANTKTQVRDSNGLALTPTIEYAPSIDYSSIAFTVPNTGDYTILTGGIVQATDSNNGIFKLTAGLTSFDNVDQADFNFVYLNQNDSTGTITSAKINSDGNLLDTLPTPTRKDYEFLGWYTALTNGTEVNENTILTPNAEIFAMWEDISVTPDPEKPNPETPDPETPDPETPDPETPNPETPVETLTITGRLVDANGNPMANVVIAMFSEPVFTFTDANGYYKLENVPVGKHTLRVFSSQADFEKYTAEIKAGTTPSVKPLLEITNVIVSKDANNKTIVNIDGKLYNEDAFFIQIKADGTASVTTTAPTTTTVPKTSDTNNIMLFVVLLAVSMAGLLKYKKLKRK